MSIVEFFGLLGMFFSLNAWFMKKDRYLKGSAALGSLMWALHFLLLQQWTGGVTLIGVALRTLSSIFLVNQSKKLKVFVSVGFIFLFTITLLFSYQNIWSVLPWIATVNATLAFLFFEELKLRRCLLISDLAWILFALYAGSVFYMFMSSMAILFNLWNQFQMKKTLNK